MLIGLKSAVFQWYDKNTLSSDVLFLHYTAPHSGLCSPLYTLHLLLIRAEGVICSDVVSVLVQGMRESI